MCWLYTVRLFTKHVESQTKRLYTQWGINTFFSPILQEVTNNKATLQHTKGRGATIGKITILNIIIFYLSVRLLWAVVVAAIVIHHYLSVFVVQA